eukprot:COSAG05_NODE_4157_length_1649_cov_1.983871_1_plen_236_part_00
MFVAGFYDVKPLQTDLSGCVALVTGAGTGLGSAIALSLAASGATVVVHYSNSAAGAGEVVQRIREGGSRAKAMQADLSQTSECAALVKQANAIFGKVDILVSNAGLGSATPISQTTDDEWERVFNLNVRATMALARELLPQMRARRFGRIITMGSVVASYGTRGGENEGGGAAYAASKAAIVGLTKGIAHEGAPWVTANVVSPGPTDSTPQHARTAPDPPIIEDDAPTCAPPFTE